MNSNKQFFLALNLKSVYVSYMSTTRSKSFEQFFLELPKNSQEKGHQFEVVIKWWLELHPVWGTHFKKIWLWDEWPERLTRDLGIDLVAESVDGKLWAIQVKAYDPESQLKKSDIDSFLSASSQKIFSDRLLVTTTRGLSGNLRNTLNTQEKPVKIIDWDTLSESGMDWGLFHSNIVKDACQ